MPASNWARPCSAAPDPSHYARSVALHPIRRGVMPTDRVHRLPQQERPRTIPPHRPQPAASDAATRPRHAHPGSEREALHPLRRAAPDPSQCTRYVAMHPLRRNAPVTSQCTRYVAIHPIRRGVMPTDRVHRLPQQAQPRAITPHRPQPSVSDAATHPQNARQCSSAAIKETTHDRKTSARHDHETHTHHACTHHGQHNKHPSKQTSREHAT